MLSGSGSFCCLVETNLEAYNGDFDGLLRAHWLNARANYRQTCVDLRDGVLQASWHEQNQFLHLTGVGITGIVAWEFLKEEPRYEVLRKHAHEGVHSIADELGLPRSKLVTTVKPSGSLSKIMSTTEGVHKPLGRYIFNNINMSIHDPLVKILQAANYHTFPNPYDSTGMLVRLPVSYENVEFDEVTGKDGETLYVNLESAVDQLERYRLLMRAYVDHNCSITVSYSPDEVPEIIDWLDEHWDEYVGVSFMYRNDPTKTAADLGYPYLPQEVVTKSKFDEYVAGLLPVDLDRGMSEIDLDMEECASGACPVR